MFVAVPVLVRTSFGSCSGIGSVSGYRKNFAVFQKQKIAPNLAFSMSEAAYFPESWPLIFNLLIF